MTVLQKMTLRGLNRNGNGYDKQGVFNMKNRKTFLFAAVLFSLTVLLYGQTISDFERQGTVLTKYKGTATDVIIPANMGITEIGEYAFFNCKDITSVTIPEKINVKSAPGTYTREKVGYVWTLKKATEFEPIVTGEINSLLSL